MPFGTIAIVSGQMAILQGLIKQRNEALQRGDTELALGYERMINDHCKAATKHLEDHRISREVSAAAIANARAKAERHHRALHTMKQLPIPRLMFEHSWWPWVAIEVYCHFWIAF